MAINILLPKSSAIALVKIIDVENVKGKI